MLSSIFVALFGLVITAIGAGLLLLVGWSLRTGTSFYGQHFGRIHYRQDRIGFVWAVGSYGFFGTLLLYIGIGVLRLTFK